MGFMDALDEAIFNLAERAKAEGDDDTYAILRTLQGARLAGDTEVLRAMCVEFCKATVGPLQARVTDMKAKKLLDDVTE